MLAIGSVHTIKANLPSETQLVQNNATLELEKVLKLLPSFNAKIILYKLTFSLLYFFGVK